MNWRLLFKIFMAWCVIFYFATNLSAAPADWIRTEDGLQAPTTTFSPALLQFGSDIYCHAEDGLYVQLYNQPCLGWSKVWTPTTPSPSFIPLGDYLFLCDGVKLWWIAKGAAFIPENWNEVISSGIPTGSTIGSWVHVIFNGYLYADVTYSSGGSTTFDIYRTSDIGSTTMTWTKVVSQGFGDPQNHWLGYLGVFKSKLIAISTFTHDAGFGGTDWYLDGIEVWESETGALGSWTQINKDGFGTEVTKPSGRVIRANCILGAAREYNGYFYVGTMSHFGAEIWRYDGTGLGGWTDVTPPTLGFNFGSGPGRVKDMDIFNNKLYVTEGVSTANLIYYNGSSWTIVEAGPNPFDPANKGLEHMEVLPSRASPSGETGDKLFILTYTSSGYQIWSYQFATQPLTCASLKKVTVTVEPKSATNELGTPAQTHTVNAEVSGIDFSDVWVSYHMKVSQKYHKIWAGGFIGTDGKFSITYPAAQGPDGLWTDDINACFSNSEESICAVATKTWVDTTPPTITISVPADGANYKINDVINANFTVDDAVGVDTTTSTVPQGSPIPTSQAGNFNFTVTSTDFGGNQTTKSVKYHVLHPPIANAGPDKSTMVGLTVTLDGSGSSDPDGSIVDYVWDVAGGTPCSAGAICSTVYSTAGNKAVTLTVTDNDGLTDSDTAIITVKTPTQGVRDLGSEIDDAQLPEDIESGLMDKLDAAINALNKGNEKAAVNMLNAFINMVNAQRGKTITNAQADTLIQMAQNIMTSINAS